MPSSKRLRTSNLTSGLAGTKIKNSACSYLEPAQILIQFKISTIYSHCQLIQSIYSRQTYEWLLFTENSLICLS